MSNRTLFKIRSAGALLLLGMASSALGGGVLPTPTVTATKSDAIATGGGDGEANPGDTLRYTIVISNSGAGDANSVTFTDTLGANLGFVAGSVHSTCLAYNQAVTTNEDTPLVITLTAIDPDGQTQIFSIVPDSGPANGTLGAITPVTATTAHVTYTPNLNYNGPDGFQFKVQDPDGNMDMATVSITVTAVNDPPVVTPPGTFTAVGNVGISVPAASGRLTGVSDPADGAGAQPFFVGGTSPIATAHGTVSFVSATGAFTYDAVAGYTGPDSFNYQVCDSGVPGSACTTATANVTVSGKIWFVNANAGTNGDGRLGTPFNTLAAFQAVNDGVGLHPAAGDTVFLYESGTNYVGPVTLLNNQRLAGQDATVTLDTIAGITLPSFSNALPAMNSGNATITNITSPGNAVTLGTNNTIRGLTVGDTTGIGISGTGFGTLVVADTSLTKSVGTRAGQALSLNNGTFGDSGGAGTGSVFGSVSSGSGTNNVNLVSVGGKIDLGTGTLSGASGTSFAVGTAAAGSGGTADITYGGTITQAAANQRPVLVQRRTGGTMTFSGSITANNGTVAGILLDTNAGSTISFTGGLNLSTGANAAFTATGGGTVNATQNNTTIVNTLTTTTGTALNVANTTIGASGLTFRSINVTGNNTNPTNGIILNNTGTSGGLKVTGNGGSCTPATPTCTGGTIQGTGSHGVSATSTSNLELNLVSIHNTGDHGIFGDGVNNFTLRDCRIFNFGNANPPTGPSEDAMHFESTNTANTAAGHGLTGTVIIQRDNIGPDGNFTRTPFPPLPENKGIVIRNHNDLDLNMSVTGTKFLQISNDGIDADIQDDTDTTAGHGNGTINVDGSTADGANDFNNINGRAVNFQNGFDNAAARTFNLTIKNDTFTSVGIGGRWAASGRGTMNALYTANTMTSTSNDAIRSESDASNAALTPHATVNATITNNTMGGGSIFISLHRSALSTITFTGNTNIGGTPANSGGCTACPAVSTGINLRSDRGSSLGIDLTGNIGTADGSPTFAQSALDLQATTNGAGNSTICAKIGGAGALQNTLTESPDTAGQQVISIDPVGGSTITIEGGPGGSPGTENFLIANNTLNGTTKVAISNPAAVPSGVGVNCVP
jgi:uncharacterized repeat protein (TIGR01451 family)